MVPSTSARNLMPTSTASVSVCDGTDGVAALLQIVHGQLGAVMNVALTAAAELIVTVHVPVPEQLPPLQPVKSDPAAAVAVNVTTVPLLNDDEQVAPQLIPAGVETIVPMPLPDFVIVRVGCCVSTVVSKTTSTQ